MEASAEVHSWLDTLSSNAGESGLSLETLEGDFEYLKTLIECRTLAESQLAKVLNIPDSERDAQELVSHYNTLWKRWNRWFLPEWYAVRKSSKQLLALEGIAGNVGVHLGVVTVYKRQLYTRALAEAKRRVGVLHLQSLDWLSITSDELTQRFRAAKVALKLHHEWLQISDYVRGLCEELRHAYDGTDDVYVHFDMDILGGAGPAPGDILGELAEPMGMTDYEIIRLAHEIGKRGPTCMSFICIPPGSMVTYRLIVYIIAFLIAGVALSRGN